MPSPPFSVKADYAYESEEPDDLTFPEGQLIKVESIEDEDWYYGSYVTPSGEKKSGIFPQNFVHTVSTAGRNPPKPPSAVATSEPQIETTPEPVPAPEPESDPEPKPESPKQTFAAPVPQSPIAAPSAPSQQEAPKPAPPTSVPAPASQQQPIRRSSTLESSSEPSQSTQSQGGEDQPKPMKKKNAFADRIAAFNASATPLVPFGQQPKQESFVKKPFIAAPSNSYVPHLPPSIPSSVPTTAKSPPPPPENIVHRDDPDSEEEKAKPSVSLKDRIKLLQQQQLEEQARMESLAAKKKHKTKPHHTDESQPGSAEPAPSGGLEQTNTGGSFQSNPDLQQQAHGAVPPPIPSQSPIVEEESVPQGSIPIRRQSTLESVASRDSQAFVDDSNEHNIPQAQEKTQEQIQEAEEEDEEEEEDDEIDEEEAKRIALRERMAKISGGMGMIGMMGGFGGFPGAMPPASSKKKTKKAEESSEDTEVRQAPVPILPFANPNAIAGINLGPPKPEKDDDDEQKEEEKEQEIVDSDTVQPETQIPKSSIESDRPALENSAPLPPPPAAPSRPSIDSVKSNESEDFKSPLSSPTSAPAFPSSAPAPPLTAQAPPVPPHTSHPSVPTASAPVPPTQTSSVSSPPALAQVIDSYRDDSDEDDDDNDDDWDDDPRVVQRRSHVPSVPAPIPQQQPEPPVSSENKDPRGPPPPPPVNTSLSNDSHSSRAPPPPVPGANVTSPTSRAPPPPIPGAGMTSPSSRAPPPPMFDSMSNQQPDTPPPVPQHASGYLPDINTSPILTSSETKPTGAPDRSNNRDSFNFDSMKQSLDYDEVLEEELGDDERTESEDNRKSAVTSPVPANRNFPSSVPPIPRRNLISEQTGGESSEEVTTGYASDGEDTPPPKRPESFASPASRAPPPPPPSGDASAIPPIPQSQAPPQPPPTRTDSFTGSHARTQSYSNRHSTAAPPPPPPSSQHAPPPPPPGQQQQQQSPQMAPQSVKSPEPTTNSNRFSFRRASSDLSRTHSRKSSQAPRVSTSLPEQPEPEELPKTIDLKAEVESWWTTSAKVPQALLNRPDISYEIEEQELLKRGGKVIIVRDIYVLFPDYSQEVITVEFNPQDPYHKDTQIFKSKVLPPLSLRQEELESAYNAYGKNVLDLVLRSSSHGLSGTPNVGYVESVISRVDGALSPVGKNNAYGAIVYMNKNNATVRQFDEIRPGDIIRFTNARFQGHKGGLHQKYNSDFPGRSAGIIYEYDTTKKKLRVYMSDEQGKLRSESIRTNDLKTGEIKIFRVVGRDYVGW